MKIIVCFLLRNSPASEVYIHTPYLPVKMEKTECSETSAYNLQTPGNYPKESIQHLEHGESLKSRIEKLHLIYRLLFHSLFLCVLPHNSTLRDISLPK
jgi:hypothetical protein